MKNIQNGGCTQDGVESVFIFKSDYLSIFLIFLFTLGKNKTFIEKLFLEIPKSGII
jgi:hypothetical protein